jgi:hypothetical protein
MAVPPAPSLLGRHLERVKGGAEDLRLRLHRTHLAGEDHRVGAQALALHQRPDVDADIRQHRRAHATGAQRIQERSGIVIGAPHVEHGFVEHLSQALVDVATHHVMEDRSMGRR